VRELPPQPLSPLEHARRRSALLEHANARFLGERLAPRARWALAAALVLALGVTAALARRSMQATSSNTSATPSSSVAADTSGPPRYEVAEAPHAIWRTHEEGSTARIDLADGVASFHVEHLGARQRFVVALPDGEIEVTGTRFSADVALGRTRSVTVVEGHVVLRRKGEREMTLRAGEGWTRTDPVARRAPPTDPSDPMSRVASGSRPAASSVASVAPGSSGALGASGALGVLGVPGPPSAAVRSRPAVSAHVARGPAELSPSRRAGERFDEAISSFVHGSYARADRELVEFTKEFPDDARCEDAAFLSAVARWRLGDAAGARARAQSYLDAYPNGLRRTEAQHIASDAR
jgi:hypothetical protein